VRHGKVIFDLESEGSEQTGPKALSFDARVYQKTNQSINLFQA